MSLFTRKKGKYVKLTKEQIRRMRRIDAVIDLQRKAKANAAGVLTLAVWLRGVKKRGMVLPSGDLAVLSMPNLDRLEKMANEVMQAIIKLEKT